MYKSYSMELAGRTLTVDIGRVAKQANGAALMHYGDTTVLSTATASKEPREGIDFFPLSVEYEEKMYAVGKIPGGFNKREGKASEHAILTSRVIDRPMRPLFPKDYRNDVTLVNMVMSVDPECNPEIPAMLGSSIATCISDIPFDGPCATTQVGLIDGEFVINPSLAQKELSDLQLTVASTREKVIMIEAGANEVPEDTMIEAIYKAHDVNQEIIRFIDKIVAECGKEKHLYASCAVPEELFEAIKKIVPPEEMEEAVFTDDKQTREENIREIVLDALLMRNRIVEDIMAYKEANDIPILQPEQEAKQREWLNRRMEGRRHKDEVTAVFEEITRNSKRIQARKLFDYNIVLIGFMGAGKSTISDFLRTVFAMEVVEMDQIIAEREGMSISDIFETYGEEYFRNLETELLIEMQSKTNVVISCGGGVPMRERNVVEMKKNGRVVLLTAKPETILSRVKDNHDRPLLEGNKNVDFIAGLMEKRREKYQAAADIVIETDGKDKLEICEELVQRIRALDAEE